MNWIKFILWLSGLYTAYYLILIAWDNLRNRQVNIADETKELSFSEDIEAISLKPELTSGEIGSSLYASGGVSLKNMFNLCRDEAVEYIKQVSF
ncbi:hypothetical protein MTO98_15975 [Mucilaginibacter sp. SMC90]|uniref:hypothetical protein n=1 Tax=Mucilaginibacter sp. SMC90 TaxID=2929803 RepID=UPI001FB2D332|nr:hypothetical protein [Mucilaginibacter sp. SMC90]UOE52575.1 hypothetical protein MTO98_15975 [Mucilaginibacter sp. SMC90]